MPEMERASQSKLAKKPDMYLINLYKFEALVNFEISKNQPKIS
jgi:hypothetical protein